ncbi:MAG TPA: hypothetical protein PLZ08_12535 [Bacillota bacterium]|jgi:hypothetical protein|nr:hypothetical protein [Bacillota bacterium]HOL08824.1 hypothetical protein [Bacillota bacterium]HPO98764.1 hypothetical protein [Bacillota bacterium]
MKKFLIKLMTFITLFLLLNILIIALPENDNDFLHAITDKHQLLRLTQNDKRLIVIGGSNVAFGVDSKKIEAQLGIRVINVAVHAGMGLKYTLDDIVKYINKGDIVLLIPEYHMFYDDKFYGGTETIEVLRICPENLNSISFKQFIQMFKGYPPYVRRKVGYTALNLMGVKKFGDIYFRDSFNEYGDLVAHLERENLIFDTSCRLEKLNPEVFSYIEQIKSQIDAHEGVLLISFPSFHVTAYNDVRKQVNTVVRELKNNSNLNIISNFQDYIFDHELFYNSIYHLNADGRELRTARLIKDLQRLTGVAGISWQPNPSVGKYLQ